jgi:type IV pilus assembly protein PilB
MDRDFAEWQVTDMAVASLAEVLVAEGLISKETLEAVLGERADTAEPVGDLLVRLGHITQRDKVQCLAKLYNVPIADLSTATIQPEVAGLIPHGTAVRLKALPIERSEGSPWAGAAPASPRGTLRVAMANPADVVALDELALITGCAIEPAIATEEDIAEAIARVFGQGEDVGDIIGEAVKETEPESHITIQDEQREPEFSLDELRAMVEGAPVVRLVNNIISRAVSARASDVHIEPEENRVRVRLRVDGLLQEVMTIPKHLQYSVCSRIKVMANMDIAERRSPQDGRVTVVARPHEYDLRISTYPAVFGENVVIRVLDKDASRFGLGTLGAQPDVQEQLAAIIEQPYGMILAAGPTGCGKTTTLYAAMNRLNSIERNILTIEDPVEYQIPGVIQASVNPKAGVTFANGLRTIVRQDPDVIMVGEIRDTETAEIAVEAALTGHLVLSTLHAGDAASSVARLMDMGIQPFLLASSLLAVVSQRLVRKICPKCQVAYDPPARLVQALALPTPTDEGVALQGHPEGSPSGSPPGRAGWPEGSPQGERAVYRRGAGCHSCGRTGYKGRTGVFEVMVADDSIRDLVMAQASSAEIARRAAENGMRTLWLDALSKVTAGITTIEEVLRVTRR